jgi:hypothetical protein
MAADIEKLAEQLARVSIAPGKRGLIIVDLNGVLVDRKYEPDMSVAAEGAARLGKFLTWKRPGVEEALNRAFERSDVAVWSSAARSNTRLLAQFVFGDLRRLRFVYDQSHCEAVPQPGENRPLFLKNLARVWAAFPEYGPRNTLLIDDSDEKSRNNPPGTHLNPGTWRHERPDDGSFRPGGKAWAALVEGKTEN